MPQLDLFSLSNQFFWGVTFFAIFYFFVSYYVIPSVFSIMFARTFFLNKIDMDSYKLVAFCFIFSSISAFQNVEIIIHLHSIVEDSYANKFAYAFALTEYVDLEINEIYEDSYFNNDEK